MEPRGGQQKAKANILCSWLACAQWLLGLTVCVVVAGLLHVSVAHGICCICNGSQVDFCTNVRDFDCSLCTQLCTQGSCFDEVANCTGLADNCGGNFCAQQTGSGFCNSPTPTTTARTRAARRVSTICGRATAAIATMKSTNASSADGRHSMARLCVTGSRAGRNNRKSSTTPRPAAGKRSVDRRNRGSCCLTGVMARLGLCHRAQGGNCYRRE